MAETSTGTLAMQLTFPNPERLLRQVDPQDGAERIRELLARGKGLIFAAPHLGNWEMGVHFLTRTTPTTVLYRPPRQQVLESVMVEGRGRDLAQVVPTDASGIRALYQALGRGEAIAVLPDQQPKEEGSAAVFAPFSNTATPNCGASSVSFV